MAGPDAYPPTPITISGRNSFNIPRASQTARGRSKKVFSRVFRLTLFKCANLTSLQRKSSRRNQPVLDAPRRTDEQYFSAVTLLQFLGNGKRGDHMSAGPAARQNCPHDLTINRKGSREANVS